MRSHVHVLDTLDNLEALSALLTKGADPVARDNQGMTRESTHTHTTHTHTHHTHTPHPHTAFHCAALSGVIESCQVLLERTGGIHGNDVDDSGRSALHLAVLGGHTECGRRLLEQGLDHSTCDAEGTT